MLEQMESKHWEVCLFMPAIELAGCWVASALQGPHSSFWVLTREGRGGVPAHVYLHDPQQAGNLAPTPEYNGGNLLLGGGISCTPPRLLYAPPALALQTDRFEVSFLQTTNATNARQLTTSSSMVAWN